MVPNVGGVTEESLHVRRTLAEEGVVVVIVTIDRHSGEIVTGPEIITRVLTVEPQRSIAARFIVKKLWTYFAYPNPEPHGLARALGKFRPRALG